MMTWTPSLSRFSLGWKLLIHETHHNNMSAVPTSVKPQRPHANFHKPQKIANHEWNVGDSMRPSKYAEPWTASKPVDNDTQDQKRLTIPLDVVAFLVQQTVTHEPYINPTQLLDIANCGLSIKFANLPHHHCTRKGPYPDPNIATLADTQGHIH